ADSEQLALGGSDIDAHPHGAVAIFGDRGDHPERTAIESEDGTESPAIVNAQSVVAADPETSGLIPPETGQRAPRHSNRGDVVAANGVQTSRAANPDRPIVRCDHGLDRRGGELVRRRKCDDRALGETVQPSRRRDPDISFAVLKKT